MGDTYYNTWSTATITSSSTTETWTIPTYDVHQDDDGFIWINYNGQRFNIAPAVEKEPEPKKLKLTSLSKLPEF